MLKLNKINPVARAVGVTSAVGILVSGVTFAALNSTATLTGNTLSTTTAGLIVNNTENGTPAAQTDTGFQFTNLVPGGGFSEAHNFTLTNNNTADLDVTVDADDDVVKTLAEVAQANDIDPVHVLIRFRNVDTDDEATYTLHDLMNNSPEDMPGVSGPNESLEANETNHFKIRVKLQANAVNGDSADDFSFDLNFTGTAVAEEDNSTTTGQNDVEDNQPVKPKDD